MVDPNQEFKLTLTAAECNIVLSALAELPYRTSFPVISKIQYFVTQVAPDAFQPPVMAQLPPEVPANTTGFINGGDNEVSKTGC